jgi:hypothetical protein
MQIVRLKMLSVNVHIPMCSHTFCKPRRGSALLTVCFSLRSSELSMAAPHQLHSEFRIQNFHSVSPIQNSKFKIQNFHSVSPIQNSKFRIQNFHSVSPIQNSKFRIQNFYNTRTHVRPRNIRQVVDNIQEVGHFFSTDKRCSTCFFAPVSASCSSSLKSTRYEQM